MKDIIKQEMGAFYRYASTETIPAQQDRVIVLDLDETLVHTFDDSELSKMKSIGLLTDPNLADIRSRLYALPLMDSPDKPVIVWGIKRPGLDTFLRFITGYFKYVCVWSAGQYDYVHAICKEIFKDLPPPALIFTRRDCVDIKGTLTKPLDKLYAAVPGAVETNTIAIDDRATTFMNNPRNGVLIQEYDPSVRVESLRSHDGSLRNLIDKIKSMAPSPSDIRNEVVWTSPL